MDWIRHWVFEILYFKHNENDTMVVFFFFFILGYFRTIWYDLYTFIAPNDHIKVVLHWRHLAHSYKLNDMMTVIYSYKLNDNIHTPEQKQKHNKAHTTVTTIIIFETCDRCSPLMFPCPLVCVCMLVRRKYLHAQTQYRCDVNPLIQIDFKFFSFRFVA